MLGRMLHQGDARSTDVLEVRAVRAHVGYRSLKGYYLDVIDYRKLFRTKQNKFKYEIKFQSQVRFAFHYIIIIKVLRISTVHGDSQLQ